MACSSLANTYLTPQHCRLHAAPVSCRFASVSLIVKIFSLRELETGLEIFTRIYIHGVRRAVDQPNTLQQVQLGAICVSCPLPFSGEHFRLHHAALPSSSWSNRQEVTANYSGKRHVSEQLRTFTPGFIANKTSAHRLWHTPFAFIATRRVCQHSLSLCMFTWHRRCSAHFEVHVMFRENSQLFGDPD